MEYPEPSACRLSSGVLVLRLRVMKLGRPTPGRKSVDKAPGASDMPFDVTRMRYDV